MTLQSLLQEAFKKNPELAALRDQIAVTRQRPAQERAPSIREASRATASPAMRRRAGTLSCSSTSPTSFGGTARARKPRRWNRPFARR